jgi:pimeloyl-ACP methyl ester carboxylesterase
MKQRHVETNGITLNVIEEGDGPAVLFVHGFPDGWRGSVHVKLPVASFHAAERFFSSCTAA